MNFNRNLFLFLALSASACKTTSKTSAPTRTQDPKRVVSSGVRTNAAPTTLQAAKASDLAATGIAPLPPEANGTWLLFCEDKNTSAGLTGLVGKDTFEMLRLADIPRNMNYAASAYVKIDGNRYAITIAMVKNSSCAQATNPGSAENLDPDEFIIFCSWAPGANVCKSTRALYTALNATSEADLNKLKFCGFTAWKSGVTYDISDKSCDQTYTEEYADGSTHSENKNVTGNRLGTETLTGRMTWDDANDVIKFQPNNGSSALTLKKANAARFFSTLDAVLAKP